MNLPFTLFKHFAISAFHCAYMFIVYMFVEHLFFFTVWKINLYRITESRKKLFNKY